MSPVDRTCCILSCWTMNYTYRNIWLINFPVMMSILIEQLINITDALFLGHVGDVELGASAIAGIWFLAIYMLGFGFSLGLQVVIARRNGEQQYSETGRTFCRTHLFLVAFWLFFRDPACGYLSFRACQGSIPVHGPSAPVCRKGGGVSAPPSISPISLLSLP